NVRAPLITSASNVASGPKVWQKELPEDRGVTPLHVAAESGATEAVRLLLKKGADANARDDNGRTPLLLAAEHHRPEIVRLLIEAGANADAKDDLGSVPLCWATGDKACVEMLLKAHADFNAADKHVGPPVLVAAYRGHTEVVKLLLASGAKLDFHAA